jgi:hypothetical protein
MENISPICQGAYPTLDSVGNPVQPLIRFNPKRSRGKGDSTIPARIIAELTNGPVIISASRLAAIHRYKADMAKANTPIPRYSSYKLEKGGKEYVIALAQGPHERFVEQPEWV